MDSIKIPCLHETGEVKDFTKQVDDYYSITEKRVKELLELAKNGGQIASQVQCRLIQGIKDIKCPREIDGKVSKIENTLSSLFVENFKRGADPKLVEEIMTLLN